MTTSASKAYRLLPVLTAGGLLMATQMLLVAPAQASCPEGQEQDPTTRMCWSQDAEGGSFYSGGGPCQPGRVGDCVGQLRPNPLQNPGPQIQAGPLDPAIAGENAWLPSNRRDR